LAPAPAHRPESEGRLKSRPSSTTRAFAGVFRTRLEREKG